MSSDLTNITETNSLNLYDHITWILHGRTGKGKEPILWYHFFTVKQKACDQSFR